MPKTLEYNATLTARDDMTSELTNFSVRYDEPLPNKPSFVPGQYVALGLNNEVRPELGSVIRSMSIASAPENDNVFDFYIRWVKYPESDNPLTHLLWTRRAGDRIYMTRKPTGKFTLGDCVGEGDRRFRIFVAAGTGLAPFISMVRSAVLRDSSVDLSRWVLLHGASYPADLGYRAELEAYADANRLRYYTTVSRPKEAPDWAGDTGRVEDFFKPKPIAKLEERLGLEPKGLTPGTASVMVCGLQGTIGKTIERLAERGFVPDNRKLRRAFEIQEDVPPTIWWEQYDNTPVVDLEDATLVESIRSAFRGTGD